MEIRCWMYSCCKISYPHNQEDICTVGQAMFAESEIYRWKSDPLWYATARLCNHAEMPGQMYPDWSTGSGSSCMCQAVQVRQLAGHQ